MASRSLKDLHPQVQLKAEQFINECDKAGIDILIYCTLRSKEEQDELYKIGRSLPGKIVTYARGGYSYHNYGLAFDWVPLIGGKPAWNDTALYARAGIIAEGLGLEWAGRWTGKLKETAHCQYTMGQTIEKLLKEAK